MKPTPLLVVSRYPVPEASTRFFSKAPIFVATSHYTRLATLLLAANRKASWNKARISYKRCACPWTIWI